MTSARRILAVVGALLAAVTVPVVPTSAAGSAHDETCYVDDGSGAGFRVRYFYDHDPTADTARVTRLELRSNGQVDRSKSWGVLVEVDGVTVGTPGLNTGRGVFPATYTFHGTDSPDWSVRGGSALVSTVVVTEDYPPYRTWTCRMPQVLTVAGDIRSGTDHRPRAATVSYGPHLPANTADVYLPPGASAAAPVPVILWVHGGGWSSGTRRDDPRIWERYPSPRHGYAVVSVDYRLSPGETWPDQGQDMQAAIAWVRGPEAAALGLDRERVVTMGWSAGGQLATWAAVTAAPGDVDGAVSLAGALITDTPGIYGTFVDRRVELLLRGRPGAEADPGRQAQARTGQPLAPLHLQHGRGDATVPLRISEGAYNRFRGAGARTGIEKLDGLGHDYQLTGQLDAFLGDRLR